MEQASLRSDGNRGRKDWERLLDLLRASVVHLRYSFMTSTTTSAAHVDLWYCHESPQALLLTEL